MEHVGTLLDEASVAAGVDLAPLNVSYGVRVQGGLDLEGPLPQVYGAAFGTAASAQTRDVAASLGLLGVGFGAEFSRAPWAAYLGLCVGRASFDLPAVRLMGLTGWAMGVELGGGYAIGLGPHLGASFRIGGQWLPVQEMTDAAGQTYRGRGMPFVDFTGLVASIGIMWSP